jgi:hypothetical protein
MKLTYSLSLKQWFPSADTVSVCGSKNFQQEIKTTNDKVKQSHNTPMEAQGGDEV